MLINIVILILFILINKTKQEKCIHCISCGGDYPLQNIEYTFDNILDLNIYNGLYCDQTNSNFDLEN